MKRKEDMVNFFFARERKNYYRQQVANQPSLYIVSRETINLIIETHRICHPKNTGASYTPIHDTHIPSFF